MDYRNLTGGHMVEALETRIGQLEGQHYSNVVYAMEAKVMGDDDSVEAFKSANKSIEKRIKALVEELEPLVKAIQNADELDEDDER